MAMGRNESKAKEEEERREIRPIKLNIRIKKNKNYSSEM
jgi:hypothetical protein